MRLPKEFEYYVNLGIIRKISPDKSRAEFLLRESELSLEGLNERIEVIGINNKNANSIIRDCYDIILERIKTILLKKSLLSSGQYAHEAEISYLFELKFSENEISFLNQLRSFRNSVTDYGKILDKEYAIKVYNFLKKFLRKLK